MRRIYMLLLSGLVFVAFGNMCQAQLSSSKAASIYNREMPSGLTQKLKVQMEDHKKKLPVAKKDAEDVRNSIKGANSKKPETMRKLWVKMHEAGPSTIPVMDEFLSSEDAVVRKNAVLSLRYMSSNGEDSPPEITPADRLIVLLLNRSLFDVDRDVRLSALVGVRKYAYSRQGNVPVEVTDTLLEALNDPDQMIQKLSTDCLRYIERIRNSDPSASSEN